MMLKPVHKLTLAGCAATVLAAVLVYAGYLWGDQSARTNEQQLSGKHSRAALARMATDKVAGDDNDEDAEKAPAPLTKTRYIAWLEKRLDAQDEAVSTLTRQAQQVAVTSEQYVEFARLVVVAAQPAAHVEGQRRQLASQMAVKVLSEFWQDTHGQPLALPEDLFWRDVIPAAATAAPNAAAKPQVLLTSSPPRAELGGRSTQVASIRAAIAEFNRH